MACRLERDRAQLHVVGTHSAVRSSGVLLDTQVQGFCYSFDFSCQCFNPCLLCLLASLVGWLLGWLVGWLVG